MPSEVEENEKHVTPYHHTCCILERFCGGSVAVSEMEFGTTLHRMCYFIFFKEQGKDTAISIGPVYTLQRAARYYGLKIHNSV